jgi:beta-galactosidase
MSIDRHPPIIPDVSHLLHGSGWHPEQWLDLPQTIGEDIHLFACAGANAVVLDLSAWTTPESEEGRCVFDWLDQIMDRLAATEHKAILAAPSWTNPAWISPEYAGSRCILGPLQVPHDRCCTSPAYRAMMQEANARLAERYARHPALGAWHISHAYRGDCRCPSCTEAFHAFLRTRHGDLAGLNRAWHTGSCGRTFSTWEDIGPPDSGVPAMILDWRRFVSEQTADGLRIACEPLRRLTPGVPIISNLMGTHQDLDGFRIGHAIDLASWDGHPDWHDDEPDEASIACRAGFLHDLVRTIGGGKPFMLMETAPARRNRRMPSRPKRPGMHRTINLQAVAHGSDGMCQVRWRTDRHACEKSSNAAVDHAGHTHTRSFRDAAALGAALKRLDTVVGLPVIAQAAVMHDWEVSWILDESRVDRTPDRDYAETCIAHYRPLWQRGLAVDVIDQTCDLSRYRLLAAPMLHLLRPGFADRLRSWVVDGGVLITTYLTGMVDENDRCFPGGWPGPLRQLLGIWTEEVDMLPGRTTVPIAATATGIALGLAQEYPVRQYCDLIHAEKAEILAVYAGEWYADRPAITRNRVGRGEAWHVAARGDDRLIEDIVGKLADRLGLERPLVGLPNGVVARQRGVGDDRHVFVMNFSGSPCQLAFDPGWRDAEADQPLASMTLASPDARVLMPCKGQNPNKTIIASSADNPFAWQP